MQSLTISKWLGIVTRFGRDSRPIGSCDDTENLQLGQTLEKMVQRTGYDTDITSAPVDMSTTKTLGSFKFPRGTFPATESPSAQNIQVLAGAISGTNYYFQKPFWKHNAATIESTNWLWYGESRSTTINSVPAGSSFVLAAGSSATDDYYNGWVIHNTTRSEYTYVLDYTGSSRTITLHEAVPTDWANTDAIILYRHFHDNPTFVANWTDPIVLKQGNNILASGGQGSTVGYKPIWSGYINKTFFSGATRAFSYNQTYVTEAELKSTGGYTLALPGVVTLAAGLGLEAGFTHYIGMVFETDDGQFTDFIKHATNYEYISSGNTTAKTEFLQIWAAQINKRFKKIHWFLGRRSGNTSADLDYEEYFFIETWDLLVSTSWTDTAPGAAPGNFNRTIQAGSAQWNARGKNLATFLGHSKPNRTTASFGYGLIGAGRLIVAKYYDYNASLNYNDQINYSPIASNGVAQYNKLLDLDDAVQSTIESGDPSVINTIGIDQNTLLIGKTRGIYSVSLTDSSLTWILNTVSREVGCDAPDSIALTPEGLIFASSGDGIYLFRNNRVTELTAGWRPTFRALSQTYVTSWRGWYDPKFKTYRMMFTSDGSTLTTFYEVILLPHSLPNGELIFPTTKHITTNNINSVLTRSDGKIYFATGALASYVWNNATTDDAGAWIKPYFDTGNYAIDENQIALFDGFNLEIARSGTTTGTLDMTVKVDDASVGTFTGLTKTNTRFASQLPIVGRNGKTISMQFNTNATRAGLGGTSYVIHALEFKYDLIPYQGDKVQSL